MLQGSLVIKTKIPLILSAANSIEIWDAQQYKHHWGNSVHSNDGPKSKSTFVTSN